MSNTITVDNLPGIINTTLSYDQKDQLTSAKQLYQDNEVMNHLFNMNRTFIKGGVDIRFRVQTATNGEARWVGLYTKDETNVGDNIQRGNVPWRYLTASTGYDVGEPEMQGGVHEIVDIIKARDASMDQAIADLLEPAWFGKPTDSTDSRIPFGLKYWVVKATGTPSFQGSLASGFAAGPGGINSDTFPTTKNWAGAYVDVTKLDLIKKMREAQFFTNFKATKGVAQFRKLGGLAEQYRIYTNYPTLATMEEIGEGNNENLGRDLATMDGEMLFRGNPIVAAIELNTDTSNPVYGVNLKTFSVVAQKGRFLKRSKASAENTGGHNMIAYHKDLVFNFVCDDRRRNWVLSVAA